MDKDLRLIRFCHLVNSMEHHLQIQMEWRGHIPRIIGIGLCPRQDGRGSLTYVWNRWIYWR